jgi:thiol-disulfide isomerase/thioredoxin
LFIVQSNFFYAHQDIDWNSNFEPFFKEILIADISKDIKDYLLSSLVKDASRDLSLKQWEELFKLYNTSVTNPNYARILNERHAELLELNRDKPAPNFTAYNKDNKPVSLDDLKGKWLYIDVWATWCGPCIAEFPSSVNLQTKLKDKENIQFVYLSQDSDKKKWLEYLDKHSELKGLNLNLSGEAYQSFYTAYEMNGIPSYILIDDKGNLIEHNMTRPSDPKTLEVLKSL